MKNSKKAQPCANSGTFHPFTHKAVESLASSKRTIEGLVGEHLDNARDAGAGEFRIVVEAGDSNMVSRIIFSDDGTGMDYDCLKGSFQIGVNNSSHRPGHLGRFGMGGTMSAIQKADHKTTVTWNGTPGAVIGRYYDMELVKTADQWVSYDMTSPEEVVEIWEAHALNVKEPGTVIIIDQFKKNERKCNALDRIKSWVGKAYQQNIVAGSLKVYVDGEEVQPKCPVGTDLKQKGAVVKKFPLLTSDGNKIADITVVELLRVPGYFSSSKKKDKDGKKEQSLTDLEGIYFSRNLRVFLEAQMGNEIGGVQRRHPNYRFIRVLVEFNDSTDDIWGITHTKDELKLDQSIRDLLGEKLKESFANGRINYHNLRDSRNSANNPVILAGALKQAQDKMGVAPKQKRKNNAGAKNTTSEKVTPINTKQRKPSPQWCSAIEEEFSGPIASPWRFETSTKTLKLNVDHKFVSEHYVGCSPEQKMVITNVAIAMTAAQIECDHLEDEAVIQMLDAIYQKLRAIS